MGKIKIFIYRSKNENFDIYRSKNDFWKISYIGQYTTISILTDIWLHISRVIWTEKAFYSKSSKHEAWWGCSVICVKSCVVISDDFLRIKIMIEWSVVQWDGMNTCIIEVLFAISYDTVMSSLPWAIIFAKGFWALEFWDDLYSVNLKPWNYKRNESNWL